MSCYNLVVFRQCPVAIAVLQRLPGTITSKELTAFVMMELSSITRTVAVITQLR